MPCGTVLQTLDFMRTAWQVLQLCVHQPVDLTAAVSQMPSWQSKLLGANEPKTPHLTPDPACLYLRHRQLQPSWQNALQRSCTLTADSDVVQQLSRDVWRCCFTTACLGPILP